MHEVSSKSQTRNKARPIWQRLPLYVQIVIALILGAGLGLLLGAGHPSPSNAALSVNLAIPCNLVLKALRALATPLIFLAVITLLLTNTTVAILFGLLVANVLQPGRLSHLEAPSSTAAFKKRLDPWSLIEGSVPDSIVKPLVDNDVIQLIVVALAFGVMLRALKKQHIAAGRTDYLAVEQIITTLFEAVMGILKWVIVLVPLAVFGIVTKTVTLNGFAPFKYLGAFILAVLLALLLQSCYTLNLKDGGKAQ